MAEQCDHLGQKQVGLKMGYNSGSIINQVLANKYPANLDNIEKAFKGAFMNHTVDCPVLGELTANHCVSNQRRPYASTNATRVQLYRACHGGCPYSRLHREKQS